MVAPLRVRAIGSDGSNKSIAPQSVPKEFQRPTVRASERASERPLEQSLKSGWAEEEGETGGSDSGNFGQRSMHAHEEECEGASRKRRGEGSERVAVSPNNDKKVS